MKVEERPRDGASIDGAGPAGDSVRDPLGGDPLGFDPLAADPLFANQVMGFEDGRRGAFGDDSMRTWNTGALEGGVIRSRGLTGTKQVTASTRTQDGRTSTHTDSYKKGVLNPGGKREIVEAESTSDTRFAKRDQTSKGMLGGTRNTKTTAFRDGDGHDNVTGTVTKAKGGKTTTADLDKKGETKGRAKTAEKEAGVKKAFGGGFTAKLGRSVKLGSVGDEAGVDLGAFSQDRDEVASFADAKAGVQEIAGGHLAEVEANAGPRVSGNVLATGQDQDAFGNARTSTAGASGEAHAGGHFSASAQHRRTGSGAEVGAKAAGRVGIGAEGAAGATTETQLSDTVRAKAGAQVTGHGFGGVKAAGGLSASHGKASAKAGAQGQAMAGVEAGGSGGITAAINGAGFDLVGARAKAQGRAMAGAEVRGAGEVSADVVKGVTAQGQVEAFGGVKAEGNASAGASLGGADGDVVAEGKANAGLDAAAAGKVNAGVLGLGAEGSLEAFAGAKAGGEARFELGAGGLNLGLIGVQGEVSAGAGVRLTGKLNLGLQKVGLKARGGVTWGVGAGLGGLFEVDPTFPVRLTLDKLAENRVISTSDLGDLVGTSASLIYKPLRAKTRKLALTEDAPGGGGGGDRLVMAQEEPEEAELPGPDRQLPLDTVLASSTAAQREGLEEAQQAVQSSMDGATKGMFEDVKGVMGAGSGLYSSFMSALGTALSSSEDAIKSADAGMRALVSSGLAEATRVAGELGAFGQSVVANIHRLVATDPKTLLDGGWEAQIDAGVERVRQFAAAIRARVTGIIERTRLAVAAIADRALDAAVAPLRSLAGSVGSMFGGFGGTVSDLGLSMIDRLRGFLVPAEKGVKVRGMNGALALPVSASPALAEAEKPVKEMRSFGTRSVSAGLDQAISFIRDGLAGLLGTRTGGLIGGLADAAKAITGVVLDAPVRLAEGAAATAKPLIRAAVAVVRAIIEAARRAAELARKAAEAAAAAARKVVTTVVTVAKKAVDTVVSGVKKAASWFLGLFGVRI